MCGIAGVLGTWTAAHIDAMAARMIAALAHRGPDGRGQQVIAAGPGCGLALAHARLGILDLSDARRAEDVVAAAERVLAERHGTAVALLAR